MAASTWFHGSAWPPGNHWIMPLGSCRSAMASTVARTSVADRIPSTSGMLSTSEPPRVVASSSGMGDLSRVGGLGIGLRRGGGAPQGLGGVHDEALAQERVQELLGDARDR